MIATTIGGNTIGTRNTVRKAATMVEGMFSSSPSDRPMSSCDTTVTVLSFTCTHTDCRNRSSSGRLR